MLLLYVDILGSAEEAGAVSPEDLDLSSILQRTTGLSYSPLLPKDGKIANCECLFFLSYTIPFNLTSVSSPAFNITFFLRSQSVSAAP